MWPLPVLTLPTRRLLRLAAAVHCLDAGGTPMAAAAGLRRVPAGLRALHADDGASQTAAAAFDIRHAAPPSGAAAP